MCGIAPVLPCPTARVQKRVSTRYSQNRDRLGVASAGVEQTEQAPGRTGRGRLTVTSVATYDLELDALPLELDRADLEVDADGGDEARGPGVVAEAQEETRLADACARTGLGSAAERTRDGCARVQADAPESPIKSICGKWVRKRECGRRRVDVRQRRGARGAVGGAESKTDLGEHVVRRIGCHGECVAAVGKQKGRLRRCERGRGDSWDPGWHWGRVEVGAVRVGWTGRRESAIFCARRWLERGGMALQAHR